MGGGGGGGLVMHLQYIKYSRLRLTAVIQNVFWCGEYLMKYETEQNVICFSAMYVYCG